MYSINSPEQQPRKLNTQPIDPPGAPKKRRVVDRNNSNNIKYNMTPRVLFPLLD